MTNKTCTKLSLNRLFLLGICGYSLCLTLAGCGRRNPVVAPGAITLLIPANGGTVGSSTPKFTWQETSNAGTYHIQVDNRTSFYSLVAEDSTLSVTEFVPDSLKDTVYYWRVRGRYGDYVWGEWSEVWSVTINAARYAKLGNCVTPGYAKDLFVVGDYAYVADGQAGLQVIDISDPTQPVIVGSRDTDKYAYGIFVQDSIAYIADGATGTGGFKIFDVRNPNSIVALGKNTYISAYDVFVINRGDSTFLLIAAREKLQIEDIADPLWPSLKGRCETPGTAYGVHGDNNYAYIADEQMGLQIMDIGELTDPEIIGSCDTPGKALDVFVSGDYAYVADGREGLQVIDISNPEEPEITGTCNTPGYANRVFVYGDRAYIADGSEGVQIIDISDPSAPSIVGECDTPYANGVFVTEDYIYVSDRDDGVVIIEK
jgi:hypothetical protein